MRRVLGIGIAACTIAAAVPAAAQAVDWAAAKEAFAEGRSGGVTPQTEDEFVGCAAFWTAWNDRVNAGDVPADAGGLVDDDLVAPDANMFAFAWLLWIDNGPDPDASFAAYEEVEPFAAQKVAEALAGDAEAMRGVMSMLGTCRLPEV